MSENTNINYPPPGNNNERLHRHHRLERGEPTTLSTTAHHPPEAIPVLLTQTSGSPTYATHADPDANGCIFVQVPGGTSCVP